MASYYDWAFRWLQSLLALQFCSVSQKIHKNCEKNENFPSKSQKMTFWCGRKKWRGRWTVNNSFNSLGLMSKATWYCIPLASWFHALMKMTYCRRMNMSKQCKFGPNFSSKHFLKTFFYDWQSVLTFFADWIECLEVLQTCLVF